MQASAAKQARRQEVREKWVDAVAVHVKAANDHARLYDKPQQIAPVPQTWSDLAPQYRSPRIQRTLRKIADMPTVRVGHLDNVVLGVNPKTKVRRWISAQGNGASTNTEYNGGQGPGGGQTWMVDPIVESFEKAALGHFWMVGQAGEKRTGKPLGTRERRNVYPKANKPAILREAIGKLTPEEAAQHLDAIARGDNPTAEALKILITARNRSSK